MNEKREGYSWCFRGCVYGFCYCQGKYGEMPKARGIERNYLNWYEFILSGRESQVECWVKMQVKYKSKYCYSPYIYYNVSMIRK